jgi:hypothetical protein
MPTNVVRFERLGYLAMAISVIAAFFDTEARAEAGVIVLAIAVVLVSALMLSLIYVAARKRKNWGRWTYAVLIALLMLQSLYDVWKHTQPLVDGLQMVSALLAATAVYFAFTADSNRWFAREPEGRL